MAQAVQDARLKELQSNIEASIAVANHAQNTVFSRFDEQRANAILDLEAAFSEFNWATITATQPVFEDIPIEVVFLTRAFELQEMANKAMKLVGERSFFFPEEFRVAIGQGWYKRAQELAIKAIEIGVHLRDDPAFVAADRSTQSSMLRDSYSNGIEKISRETHIARRVLSEQLEKWFKDASPLHGETDGIPPH